MEASLEKQLRDFFRLLEDRPLEPDDRFYEPSLQKRRGYQDPIEVLARNIEWSEAGSVNLLSGQRGSGKSTELRRLRKLLEDRGLTVFLLDMRSYLNLSMPVEITDFLVSIMGAFSDRVKEQFGKDFGEPGFWERFSAFMTTEIPLDTLQIKAGGMQIKSGIRDDPTFKRRMQEQLRGHVSRVVEQAHEFAAELVAFLRRRHKNPDLKVVLLVDSMEQIRGVGMEASAVHQSVENLFAGHAEHLHLDQAHLVYTVPPYLAPLAPGVGRHFGGMIYNLPNVHVYQSDGETPDPEGLAVMRALVSRRYAAWEEMFKTDHMNRLILATGGDLRDFMRLVRAVLTAAPSGDGLPISSDLIQSAMEDMRRDMIFLSEADKKWLQRIAETRRPELEETANLHHLAKFFDANLVQCYRNGEDWYHIHPLLRNYLSTS